MKRPPSYQHVAALGAGGMATVDLVLREEKRFRRLYALKRPHPHLRDHDQTMRMFMDEARLAGLIRHPHVVSVLDVGMDAQGPYLAMEYVEGVSAATVLETFARAGELLPLPLCVLVAAHAAAGLHAAHELVTPDGHPLGLVHRDVSPQNVLIGFDGFARVTDFGVAKALGNVTATLPGTLKGHVGYMSPEQLRGEPIDRRADLFALGVVLYELLAGEHLYDGADVSVIARRILEDVVPPDLMEVRPDAPPALTALLFDLLARDPNDRPATAAIVADRLQAIFDELVSEGAGFRLATFLEDRFGDERRRRAAQMREALTSIEAQRTPAWRRPKALLGGAGALVGAAGVLWLVSDRPRLPERGLRGEYFADTGLRDRRLVRIDRNVYFDWGYASPDPSMPSESYSVRWSGFLIGPTSGTTRVCVNSDDGSRLWIDDRVVIEDWTAHNVRMTCARVPLKEGHRHRLKLEYFQGRHKAVIHLLWHTGRLNLAVAIPDAYLEPP